MKQRIRYATHIQALRPVHQRRRLLGGSLENRLKGSSIRLNFLIQRISHILS